MPEWIDKWVRIGLSTEPADFEAAKSAALALYDKIGYGRPKVVLTLPSPLAGAIGGLYALELLQSQFHSQVISQVISQVRSQVGSQVRSQVDSQVGSQVASFWSNEYGGEFYSAWPAYVTFYRDVLGWDDPCLDTFAHFEVLSRSCGWALWHEDVLVLIDRPEIISRDEDGRLHNETGPAMRYRDGWSVYAWRGTVIPDEWMTDGLPSASELLHWDNIEQRRAGCEMLGWNAILDELDASTIDQDADPTIGTLLEANIPDSGPERFLKVQCGTGRTFVIPVPPNSQTALSANLWTYGLDDQNLIPEIRT